MNFTTPTHSRIKLEIARVFGIDTLHACAKCDKIIKTKKQTESKPYFYVGRKNR